MIEFASATQQPAAGWPADRPATEDRAPVPLERLGDEIAELAAHLHAATYRLLVRLAEFDRREGWSGGFRSCAHWLSWRTGIGPAAAREKVRVARALERLPLLSAAMARGELSYAKVRAATRVATPGTEGEGVMPGGHEATTMMTLGYDPEQGRYVGTWIGSMATHLWVYEHGELDVERDALTLEADGPMLGAEGQTTRYRDVIQFNGAEHRVLTAYMQQEEGSWRHLMTVSYRRGR